MKKLLFTFLIIFTVVSDLYSSGGSIYSRFGLGDLYFSYTARRMGLGELGIAVSDFDFLNNLNPASWSSIRLTRFESGFIYHGNNISSTNASAYYSQSVLSGMMIAFPLKYDYGISLAAGVVPYSNINYEIASNETNNLTDPYKLTYKGDGGISKLFVGLSYKLPFDFSLGASLDYYNGKIEYSTAAEFSTNNFLNSTFTNKNSYSGIGYSFGLISNDFSNLFGISQLTDLRLGITYSGSTMMDVDSVHTSTTAVGDITNESGVSEVKIPHRFGFGLKFNWTPNYTFLADYIYQPFSGYQINNTKLSNLRDFSKISLGLEYRNLESRTQTFWEQILLRCGLSFEKSQYVINNNNINQFSIYAGLSMPIGFDSTIDFALQYGKRGTTENNLLNENIYKFSITLSIGELWFITTDR